VYATPIYPQAYEHFMELAKLALKQGDYKEAYSNFQRTLLVGPNEKEPTVYMKLIKRLLDH